MVRAGQLKDLVKIQKPAAAPDSSGQRSGWELFAKIYAEVVQLQGKELLSARQLISNVTTSVRVRYEDAIGVDSGMQVLVEGGRVLDIQSVIDVQRKHEMFELLCVESS